MGMRQIVFLVSLESSPRGRGASALVPWRFGLAVQKLLNIEWFLHWKWNEIVAENFRGHWNVPLVLLERSWWSLLIILFFTTFLFYFHLQNLEGLGYDNNAPWEWGVPERSAPLGHGVLIWRNALLEEKGITLCKALAQIILIPFLILYVVAIKYHEEKWQKRRRDGTFRKKKRKVC
jgi:hypothetical protein